MLPAGTPKEEYFHLESSPVKPTPRYTTTTYQLEKEPTSQSASNTTKRNNQEGERGRGDE
jgi:Tfp pilus assembly protein PilE